jgi:hypothetical protein
MSDPIRTSLQQRTWPIYAAAFAAALALYLASMAPGVLWQDSGMAQVRTLRRDLYGGLGLALSHPLYYVFTIASQSLPIAESAPKTNLVSAFFGAVTVANLFLFLYLLTGRSRGAIVGSVSLAVAHTFWQHCALAEVYTVTTALLTGELLCLLQYCRTGRFGWLVLMFLCNGLGVSNHMMAVLSLACYTGFVLWLLGTRKLRARLLPLLALAWAAGASIYLVMIGGELWRGAGLNATIRSALFGMTFARNVLNVFPGRRELLNSVLYLGMDFPTPAALLLVPGVLALRERGHRPLRVAIAALLAAHLVWAVRYDVADQYTFFIPSLVLIAVVIGLGADRFLQGRSRRWTGCLALLAALPAVVYIPLPEIARALHVNLGLSREVPYRDEYSYFLHPWKTGYRGAQQFAEEVRDRLPDGSTLFADSTTVQPIHYLQLTGRWRREVRVWPAADQPDMAIPGDLERRLASELAAGRVYVVSAKPGYCPPWLLDGYGFCPVPQEHAIVYRVCGRKARSPDR